MKLRTSQVYWSFNNPLLWVSSQIFCPFFYRVVFLFCEFYGYSLCVMQSLIYLHLFPQSCVFYLTYLFCLFFPFVFLWINKVFVALIPPYWFLSYAFFYCPFCDGRDYNICPSPGTTTKIIFIPSPIMLGIVFFWQKNFFKYLFGANLLWQNLSAFVFLRKDFH